MFINIYIPRNAVLLILSNYLWPLQLMGNLIKNFVKHFHSPYLCPVSYNLVLAQPEKFVPKNQDIGGLQYYICTAKVQRVSFVNLRCQ